MSAPRIRLAWLLALLALLGAAAAAEPSVQSIGAITGAGPRSASAAGLSDYLGLVDRRDGGIGGVRLELQVCAAGADDPEGRRCLERLAGLGAAPIVALGSGIARALGEHARAERTVLLSFGHGRPEAADGRVFPHLFTLAASPFSQAAAQIGYIALAEGGLERLPGKRIAYLHGDAAASRDMLAMLQALAGDLGFVLFDRPLAPTGPAADWHSLGALGIDWVLLGASPTTTAAALGAAAAAGFPAGRIIGSGSAPAEAELISAGRAAVGFLAVSSTPPGGNFAVIRDIRRQFGDSGLAAEPAVLGSAAYNRGVASAIVVVEAIRVGQRRFGARPLGADELRWALEHLSLDDARLAQLGALELLQPLHLSCADHEGGGAVKFQQWIGSRWSVVSDWISGDSPLARGLVEQSARRHATAHGIAPRDCRDD